MAEVLLITVAGVTAARHLLVSGRVAIILCANRVISTNITFSIGAIASYNPTDILILSSKICIDYSQRVNHAPYFGLISKLWLIKAVLNPDVYLPVSGSRYQDQQLPGIFRDTSYRLPSVGVILNFPYILWRLHVSRK